MKGIMLKDLYENFCIPKHLAAYIFGYCVTIICTFLSANQYTFILFTGIVFPILGACAAEYSTEEDEKSNLQSHMPAFFCWGNIGVPSYFSASRLYWAAQSA